MKVFAKDSLKNNIILEFSTTELNKTSKKAQHFIKNYEYANLINIYDAYKKPSQSKIYNYNKCYDFKNKIGGYRQRIIGFNHFSFTFAYLVSAVDGEYLIVDTKCYRYSIKISVSRGT